MEKKYAIFTTTGTRFDSSVVFYTLNHEQFINCSWLVDSVTLDKAIEICKSTQISTWIVEDNHPILKELIQSHRRCFNDFIDNCKKSGLELIETRPSIYPSSEVKSKVEPKIESEMYEVKVISPKKGYGYIIKQNESGRYVCSINLSRGGYNTNSSITAKSITYYRTKKDAKFQCKVMKLKYKKEFSVVKIDLYENFK